MKQDVESVKRQPAASGRVSYGDPIILNDTAKRRVVFIPFYIPHSDRTELAGKIITYLKRLPPLEWSILEEKSLSLPGDATRKLLAALRTHLAVATEQEDGNYLLIRVTEGTALIGEHDPAQVASALTKVLSQPDVVEHLRDTELSSELVGALRGAIKLNEMKSAVAQLRSLLESGENGEEVYQRWCESHSWAFGNAYVVCDEVRNISAGDRLDILLPSVIAGYRDLVELKRPDMPVLKYDESHRNYYFAGEVSKAIGQCHRYLDILHEVAAKGLLDHPEIVAYHPRAIIVIGQSRDWSEEKLHALHGLNRRLSGITVMTYNHLLAQGERLIEMLAPKPEDTEQDMIYGEDVPF